jgi:hypothetical protein
MPASGGKTARADVVWTQKRVLDRVSWAKKKKNLIINGMASFVNAIEICWFLPFYLYWKREGYACKLS